MGDVRAKNEEPPANDVEAPAPDKPVRNWTNVEIVAIIDLVLSSCLLLADILFLAIKAGKLVPYFVSTNIFLVGSIVWSALLLRFKDRVWPSILWMVWTSLRLLDDGAVVIALVFVYILAASPFGAVDPDERTKEAAFTLNVLIGMAVVVFLLTCGYFVLMIFMCLHCHKLQKDARTARTAMGFNPYGQPQMFQATYVPSTQPGYNYAAQPPQGVRGELF